MQKKSLIFKSVIVILILSVAIYASGCYDIYFDKGNSGEEATYYIANPDFKVSFSGSDKERIDGKMADADRLLGEGSDCVGFEKIFEDVVTNEIGYLSEQMKIAETFTYLFKDDEETFDVYNSIVEYRDVVTDWENEMYVKIRDSAFKEQYFEGLTDEEIDAFIDENDIMNEYYDLYIDGIALENEYYALSDSEFYAKVPELYCRVVDNNKAIAETFGYDNYVDFAYENVYLREYSADDVSTFNDYVISYILPLYKELNFRLIDDWASMTDSQFSDFAYAVYDMNWDIVDAYFKEMGFGDMFDSLITSGNMIISYLDSSYGTAFVYYISDSVSPVMYIGPGYADNTTLVHEFGHYYDAVNNNTSDYDLAETHSQGDEAIFWAWMQNNSLAKYNASLEKYKDKVIEYYLYNAMNTVILTSIIDSFEQYVYTHDLHPSELDDAMRTVCESYGGYDEISMLLNVDILDYWRRVVVTEPCYYISYAVSMIGALQIYCLASEDFQAAKESYLKLFEYEEGQTYTEILSNAGLLTPFNEQLYKVIDSVFR